MGEPIFITGAGIISAIGNNKQEILQSLLQNVSGIAPLKYLKTEHTEFPVGEVKLSNEQMIAILGIDGDAAVTRTSLMGMIAVKEALEQACLLHDKLEDVGFISGTTVGGMDMSEQYYADFLNNDIRNEYIDTHDCGACSQMIADHFGKFGFITTISTACSSAANAIILGANMIRAGEAETVVVGGSECITKFHLNGFNSLMILDKEKCRPFDKDRAGLNLGEGAAFLVLESRKSVECRAKECGVKSVAVLSGYANACDAFHQTASSDNGQGAYLAMKNAIEDAGMSIKDIDYINAHGTGTPNNDLSESTAMLRLFGNKMPAFSSTKSFTGHTTSASGSIEAIISILALQNGFLPANLNFSTPMENGVVPVSAGSQRNSTLKSGGIKHVLCNSFGFGGNDSSLLLSNVCEYGKE